MAGPSLALHLILDSLALAGLVVIVHAAYHLVLLLADLWRIQRYGRL
jgi:hypothetical protein